MPEAILSPFPGVQRRKNSTVWQFGLRVPKDLQRQLPGEWAVRCSLKTSDLRQANDRARALQAEWAEKFAAMRSGRAPTIDATALRAQFLAQIEARLPEFDQRTATMVAEVRASTLSSLRWEVSDVREAMHDGRVPDWAEARLDRWGYPRSRAADAEALPFLAMLLELYAEALADVSRTFPLRVRQLQERRALIAAHVPAIPPVAVGPMPSPLAPADSDRRIGEALTAWEGLGMRKPKTRSVFARHAEQFRQMAGDPPLSAIGKAEASRFRADLQRWAVEHGKTKETADNVLTSIKALVTVAVGEGWIPSNPFAGLAVNEGGRKAEAREPWTHDELPHLFDSPIFTAYQLPPADTALNRKAGAAAAYWVPLICLYTGARPGEVCQLWTDDLADVPDSEGRPLLVLEFRANEARGQSLKNPSSWRALPAHGELIRLGLRAYWQAVQEQQAQPGPLFPAIPKAGANGPGGQFGQWFGAFKKGQGFGPAKTLHSFRHTLETELGFAGVSPTLVDAITGHEGQGIGRKQYAATIRRSAVRLHPAIEKLHFPSLHLTLVCPAAR